MKTTRQCGWCDTCVGTVDEVRCVYGAMSYCGVDLQSIFKDREQRVSFTFVCLFTFSVCDLCANV